MEKGKVVKIINNSTALVSFENSEDCEYCAGKSGCLRFGSNDMEVRYKGKLEINESVYIKINSEMRIMLSILIFFLPIIFLIFFYFISFHFFKNEEIASIVSIFGFIILFSFLILIIRISKIKKKIMACIKKTDE